jgi:transposase
MDMKEEVIVWNVYNTIREIENTFRTLKTDLDLRPIYHKKDESTIAHLNLGLLSYWLANTIRCQLKLNGINYCWKEIVRIGNTQKVITTTGYNKANHEIIVRKCTEPEEKLKALHTALKIKNRPFTKLKSVVHKPKQKNPQITEYKRIASG